MVWVGDAYSWSPRDICDRRAGVDKGVLTVAEGRALGRGCPYDPQVRASRYAKTSSAAGKAHLELNTTYDLMVAIRRWLVGMLAFDRFAGRWVWLDHDDSREGLVVTEVNWDLTSPHAAGPAQQWAAELLSGDGSEVRLCDLQLCGGSVAPLRLTEWRSVWYGGIRHYAPLFAGTQTCHIPVSDLDPATGAACFCTKRKGERDG